MTASASPQTNSKNVSCTGWTQPFALSGRIEYAQRKGAQGQAAGAGGEIQTSEGRAWGRCEELG